MVLRSLGRGLVRRVFADMDDRSERTLLAIGRLQANRIRDNEALDMRSAEFGIFSQWNEDGIIQFLTHRVSVAHRTFVEFGVDDYRESNTRFLLQNDYWHGLIIDAGTKHLEFVRASRLGWRHTIDAISAFITRENINALIAENGFVGDLGLLSIDVDGNDYWLLQAITVVTPRIIVVEYNSLFGPTAEVSVPYDPAFRRNVAHDSGIYYGASLAALAYLLDQRGYDLVGCDSAGVNAFFVKSEYIGNLHSISSAEAYVPRQHRETRDAHGYLTYLSDQRAQLALIARMPLVDVRSNLRSSVADTLLSQSSPDR